MASIFLDDSNVNELSVEGCILKLVKLSLSKEASSIAVRFDPKNRKIQVVDNGVGYSKQQLLNIFVEEQNIFYKLHEASEIVIVTSRSESSSHTYVHIVGANGSFKFFEGYHRPSKGTTVTAYRFRSWSWDSSENNKNNTISYILAGVALTNSMVSFTLRNDNEKRVLLNVTRPHSSWEIFKCLNNNHINHQSTEDETAVRSTPDHDVSEEKAPTTNTQQICIFASLLDKSFDDDDENNGINDDKENCIFYSLLNKSTDEENLERDAVSEQSKCPNATPDVGKRASATTQDHNFTLCCSSNQIKSVVTESFINLSQLSVWSDWSHQPESRPKYDFSLLPISKVKNIPRKPNNNLMDDRNLDRCPRYNFQMNDTLQGMRAHYGMATIRRFEKLIFRRECQVSKNTINTLQILRQVNNEFIAAITHESDRKLLLIIDQHAVHERIRYEWLIDKYRDKNSFKFDIAKLREDLLISNIDSESLKLLANNKKMLMHLGIHLKSIVDPTSCTVDGVPKCFTQLVKNYNFESNIDRLTKNVRQLLLEIANGIAVSNCTIPPILPIAINNVIASEACHGAIKFSDPLNVKECTALVEALQDTKDPTRCAHGRPTMIPLMDLADLKIFKPPAKTRLNFEGLRNRIYIKKKK